MASTLGIDGGASATKWALRYSDGSYKEGTAEAIDGHIYRPASKARLENVLRQIRYECGSVEINSIVAGITGLGGESEKDVHNLFSTIFPSSKIALMTDIVLGYRANLNLGEGIFLYAGTGSIAIHLKESGEMIRVGGWGYLLGDEGAGYWIGREAIRRTLKLMDTGKKLGNLHNAVLDVMSAHNWNEIKSFVYSEDRSSIAEIAEIVVKMAEDEEEEARTILRNASLSLVGLAQQIQDILGRQDMPIVLGGGIVRSSEYLVKELKNALGENALVSNVRIANKAAELAITI